MARQCPGWVSLARSAQGFELVSGGTMMRSRGGSRLRGEVKSSETRVRSAKNAAVKAPTVEVTDTGAENRRAGDPAEREGHERLNDGATGRPKRATQTEAFREDVLIAVRQAVTTSAHQRRSKFEVPVFDINFARHSAGAGPSLSGRTSSSEREATFPHPANENFPPATARRVWPLALGLALVGGVLGAFLIQPWMSSQIQPVQAATDVVPREVSAVEPVSVTPAPMRKTVASMVREAENNRVSDLTDDSRTPERAPQPEFDATVAGTTRVSAARIVRPSDNVSAAAATSPDALPADAATPKPAEKSAALLKDTNRLAPADTSGATNATAPTGNIPANAVPEGSGETGVSPDSVPELTTTERARHAIANAREGDPAFAVVGTLTLAQIEHARAEYARAAQLAGPEFPPLVAVLKRNSVVAAQSIAGPVLSKARGLSKEGRVREARAMMQLLAFANIPEVSFAIARSYDPTYLATLPTHDAKGSIESASDWYRRWHADSVRAGQVSVGAAVERLIQVMKRSP